MPAFCASTSIVDVFQSIPLEDNVPRVQPTPSSIDYEVAPPSNLLQYIDHGGYKTELGAEVEVRLHQSLGVMENALQDEGLYCSVLIPKCVSSFLGAISGALLACNGDCLLTLADASHGASQR